MINFAQLDKYALKCPACGYERRLNIKDVKIKRGTLVVKAVCPKCGAHMTIIPKP